MFFHDRGQNVGRQVQEPLLEMAEDRGRLLHEVGHLVQQCGLVGNRAAGAGREVGDLLKNQLAPLVTVDDDAVLRHDGGVSAGCRNLDRW